MSLKTRIQSVLRNLIPSKHRTHFSPIEGIGIASSLDIDRLHTAIRQAEGGFTQPLFAIYQEVLMTDNYVQSLLDSRKRAALKDEAKFPPSDKNKPEDVAASRAAEMMFSGYNPDDDELDDWQLAMGAMMDAVLWPVHFLSKRFVSSNRPGLRYELGGLKLVDPQLLDWTQRKLLIADTEEVTGTRTGTYHTPDPAQYIKHQGHLLTMSGNRGGPMRSLLFWWLFATMNRDWWGRFLDRFGAPFLVGKFNDADDEGRATLQSAFSAASKLLGVVVSSETDVEVVAASGGNATGEAFEKFRNICRKEMAVLICGGDLSTESAATGLGSGVADLQGDKQAGILEFDHRRLAMTLMRTVKQFLVINGYVGSVDIVWGGKKSTDIAKLGSAMASFKNAGIVIAEESLADLSEDVGFTLVKEGVTNPLPGERPGMKPVTLSADPVVVEKANEDAIGVASAKLSRMMRESLAPVRSILAESSSPDDLERRLALFFADLSLADRAAVTEELLASLAANGSTSPF